MADLTTEFRTDDGVTLRYLETEGAGRPVVLIAGFTAPAESWALQVPALAAAGHRVLSLDRRSHGGSQSTLWGQRMARHGKDLADFLAALDLRDVVLVGGSMGGNVVWSYVDLFGTGRIAGVVVVDQTPKMVNDDTWPYGFYGLTPQTVGTLFADGIPATGHGPANGAGRLARLAAVLATYDPPPVMRDARDPELRGLLQDHAAQDWRDVVARVDVPVLFVAGRDSQFWPCEHAAAAVEGNPHARSLVLEDCGHAANADQPDAFNAAVLEFLETL